MWCRVCKRHLKGIVNKVRHKIAMEDTKLDNDCGRFREVPVGRAINTLDNEMVDLSLFIPKMKKSVTLREFMRIMRPHDLTKLNDRNHDGKSNGSDLRRGKHKDNKSTRRQRRSEKARRKARAKREIDE